MKQNGEGVNKKKNKNAYGGYSKYYSSSILIIMGLETFFCQRSGLDRKREDEYKRAILGYCNSEQSGH